jgi:diaminopimelate decarboxylase
MSAFAYRHGVLHAENVPLPDVAAAYGTPCYVYSRAALTQHFNDYASALKNHPHRICYAVKANSNLAVLNVLARLGAGFDIVSVGELERVLAAGGDASKVVFSGVGKQIHEMRRALEVGVACFNVESIPELARLNKVAGEMKKIANISLRVNPDVDAQTHPYIATGLKDNKFGIDINEALNVYQQAAQLPHLKIVGIDCHIGSQLLQITPFLDALDRLLVLIDELQKNGIKIEHLDIGGGLGVRYRDETPPTTDEYMSALLQKLGKRDVTLVLEPGRSIAANAGVLLTRVEYIKKTPHKNFAILDCAMNDLLRPALYKVWQDIIPIKEPVASATTTCYDVVGPVCETGDFLGKDRALTIAENDLLAICSAGAYGFVMSSNYNTRNRPAEVMIDSDKLYLIKTRETLAQQIAGETLLPAD